MIEMLISDGLARTDIRGLYLVTRGKVRDVYQLDDHLLFVATDRISAFDSVMPTPIPDKGRILTALSAFWFSKVESITSHHVISTELPDDRRLAEYCEMLRGRCMVVYRAEVLPVEFVVRGYLYGSAFVEYKESGKCCGIQLPDGLQLAERLPEPILTPATKSKEGHDINISQDDACQIVGADVFREVKAKSIRIYELASKWLSERGILLCDTKFEFGILNGELLLVDELLTPDSSRLWDAAGYRVGQNPPNFDKQFVRDYLMSVRWNKEPPAPALPCEVIQKTRGRYLEVLRRVTGIDFDGLA